MDPTAVEPWPRTASNRWQPFVGVASVDVPPLPDRVGSLWMGNTVAGVTDGLGKRPNGSYLPSTSSPAVEPSPVTGPSPVTEPSPVTGPTPTTEPTPAVRAE